MVRVSGAGVAEVVRRVFEAAEGVSLHAIKTPSVVEGALKLAGNAVEGRGSNPTLAPPYKGGEICLPCCLYLWPGERSYTREPVAEFHTVGSPPLLEAVLAALCAAGARLAEPGCGLLTLVGPGGIGKTRLAIEVAKYIAQTQPTVVFIAHSYGRKFRPALPEMTPADWTGSLRRLVDTLGQRKVVLLAAPPMGYDLQDCYGKRGSVPSDCVTGVGGRWNRLAYAERDLAAAATWTWIDSRPWFCAGRYCPAFVGTTPTRRDEEHMSPAYGSRLSPVIAESLHQAGVL